MVAGTPMRGLLVAVVVLLASPGLARQDAPAAEIGIADQESSGHAIIVDVARLSQPGFVVIHDETLEDGEAIESILGASRVLSPALHFDVLVRIDPPLERDQRVIAMLHVDSNHNGVFDLVRTGSHDRALLQDGAAVTDDARIDLLGEQGAPGPSATWVVLAVLGAGFARRLRR